MMKLAIGRYGADDWRLVRWDGTTETEIGPDGTANPASGWTEQPDLRDVLDALMDYHGEGSSPFSSREGTLDAIQLGNEWPLATHNREAGHEYPWNR